MANGNKKGNALSLRMVFIGNSPLKLWRRSSFFRKFCFWVISFGLSLLPMISYSNFPYLNLNYSFFEDGDFLWLSAYSLSISVVCVGVNWKEETSEIGGYKSKLIIILTVLGCVAAGSTALSVAFVSGWINNHALNFIKIIYPIVVHFLSLIGSIISSMFKCMNKKKY